MPKESMICLDEATSMQIKAELGKDHRVLLDGLARKLTELKNFRLINRYDVIKMVSRGAYGAVTQARMLLSSGTSAVKTFLPEHYVSGVFVGNLREMKMMQKLSHENVVAFREICHSAVQAQGRNIRPHNGKYALYYHLVMEYCEFSLHSIRGIFESHTTAIQHIMYELTKGVDYIHRVGVIHRDLKPRNILVSRRGCVKICDFGCACFDVKWERGRRHSVTRAGTLWYKSPEVLSGSSAYDTAVDVWALGCIFAELHTNFPIFRGDNVADQLAKIGELCGDFFNSSFQTGKNPQQTVKDSFSTVAKNKGALSLLDKLLVLDPRSRSTARQALNHRFFRRHKIRSKNTLLRVLQNIP